MSTTRADGSRCFADSMAATSGSGFITMPAPPPYGTSSVTRCFPSANSRMSVTCTRKRPAARALPRMLSSSGAATIRGNSVSTSTDSTSFLHFEQPFRHFDHDTPGL